TAATAQPEPQDDDDIDILVSYHAALSSNEPPTARRPGLTDRRTAETSSSPRCPTIVRAVRAGAFVAGLLWSWTARADSGVDGVLHAGALLARAEDVFDHGDFGRALELYTRVETVPGASVQQRAFGHYRAAWCAYDTQSYERAWTE